MALNKNALIRYRTIDKCLQNRQRRWTLNDLIEACSEALYEYEGKDVNVSRRTVQLDIQTMRSDKLGYNAPIVVYDKKYYTYEEDFSITDIPLTEIDMDILAESVEMLKQFKDFSLFSELNGVIQKLEDRVYREKNDQAAIIHMDKNENLKGLNHLDTLYQAILKKMVLLINYQSFRAESASILHFHPYILKEFNNRWFVIGRVHERESITTLALDRIHTIDFDLKTPYEKKDFDADQYYQNTFGVTVLNEESLIDIELWVERGNAPYVLTKPIHHSQKLLEKNADGSIRISLSVHHNFEIERLILGYGDTMEVLAPMRLRERIRQKLQRGFMRYVRGDEEASGQFPDQ